MKGRGERGREERGRGERGHRGEKRERDIRISIYVNHNVAQ
jgi:hypothetical protein